MGTDFSEKKPSNNPDCSTINKALNATASTAGKKRCRSCHRAAGEWIMRSAHAGAPVPRKITIRGENAEGFRSHRAKGVWAGAGVLTSRDEKTPGLECGKEARRARVSARNAGCCHEP